MDEISNGQSNLRAVMGFFGVPELDKYLTSL